jgi:hypothetical protein
VWVTILLKAKGVRMKKNIWLKIGSLLVLSLLVLSACAPAAPAEEAAPMEEEVMEEAPAEEEVMEEKLAVGIVLPTKDEPRWIQDEARCAVAHLKGCPGVDHLPA